ncbi:hypothetical protein K3495_g4946 [Podosphaera aphanis]|nr:hypothetical protein K3495_g4946 [Podosphaera aphanis]
MPKISQKRVALTDQQRQMIRKRHKLHPNSQQGLIAWFASQPRGRNLTQGQVSVILSDKYQYLDSDTQKTFKLNSKRNYLREHEELELALFELQQRMQGKRAVITGDILKAKARELWQRLPQYTSEMEEPK